MRKYYKLCIDVTVNDDGFDKPSGGSIQRTEEIPTASLNYPNPGGRFFRYFKPRDVVKIYVGVDSVPDLPTFTGFVTSAPGGNSLKLGLHSRLYSAQKASVFLDNYTNYDGWEVSRAIQDLLGKMDVGFFSTTNLGGTRDPAVFVESDIRFDNGVIIYDLIKKLRDMSYSIDQTTQLPLSYHLYEPDDETISFQKQKPLSSSYSWFDFIYGENILAADPEVKTTGIINKQTVIGAGGIRATYVSAHRVQLSIDGINEGRPVVNGNLKTRAECWEEAKRIVESNKFAVVNTRASSVKLAEAIPKLAIVNVANSPNIVDGPHRVVRTTIDFTKRFSVVCDLERVIPLWNQSLIETIRATSDSSVYA